MRIPDDARPDETPIFCDDCGKYLGTRDEPQTDFEKQGGQNGVFRLERAASSGSASAGPATV
ncbi:MAG: hypothetical protein E5V58_17095 [Mesorhizobium sp.]|nr:MAG: hypothetical protein E5V58_17095 [Mesorhizobium sp.]